MGRPRRSIVPLDAGPVAVETASPLSLVPPEPEPEVTEATSARTPARQKLADAIATVRALEAEVAAASVAIEPARQATWAAQSALDEAEDALRSARPRDTYAPPPSAHSFWGSQAQAEGAARRARAAAESPPISVADAKAAVEIAKDNLDTARRTRQWHEDRLKAAEDRLQFRRGDIPKSVRYVVRSEPAMLALANECRRLKTRAEAARRAFSSILHGDVIQPGSPFYGWDSIPDARSSDEAMADWSISREWYEALEALHSDPDAVLPMPS